MYKHINRRENIYIEMHIKNKKKPELHVTMFRNVKLNKK